MPLQVSTESPAVIAEQLDSAEKPAFLVVYASLVNGRMWCSDCRDAEKFVNEAFEKSEEDVKVVYAGNKEEFVPCYGV